MNNLKHLLVFCFLIGSIQVQAQQKTNLKKPSTESLDSAFLLHPFRDKIEAFKKSIKKDLGKIFIDFNDNNIYVLSGIGFSKQFINTGSYNSIFNYDLENNKSAFKPGYFAGFRVDGIYKEKHLYSFAFSLDKISSGTSYSSSTSLQPFIGNFSRFKGDDQFLNLSIAAHYKKLLPFKPNDRTLFYLVAGPSIDTRLSGQSADNLVNNNYRRFLLRADIGIEYENKSFYTLFMHYKQGVTSFTKSPVSSHLNSLEIGLLMKASDIF
jgi:hypothetical protein